MFLRIEQIESLIIFTIKSFYGTEQNAQRTQGLYNSRLTLFPRLNGFANIKPVYFSGYKTHATKTPEIPITAKVQRVKFLNRTGHLKAHLKKKCQI